jgi:hypothetical protein
MSAPVTKMENKLSAQWREHQKAGGLDGVFLVLSLIFFIVLLIVLGCMWSSTMGGAHIPRVTY